MRSLNAGPRLRATRAAPAETQRRDPAPSRLSYRLERLRLTPAFHQLLRVWLPAIAVVTFVTLWFSSDSHRAAVVAKYVAIKTEVQNRPEFMVSLMQIDGASPAVDGAIRKMLPVTLPVSSFRIDLEALRRRIETIDAVKQAELRVQSGGVLRVRVTERVPVVIWRTDTGMQLLDDTGHRVATLLARDGRPDLPLIAGQGADRHVPEALAILAASGPVTGRVRGLVYVGERRWDIVLDRSQRILLPQDDPVVATERVVVLNEAQDMLGRDVLDVDMRNTGRPTLRLTPGALADLRNTMTGHTEVAGE
jgi:cell division protein FtsQ